MIELAAASQSDLRGIEDALGLVLTKNAKGIVAHNGHSMLGCVAYDLWTENSVFAHMWVPHPIAWRRLLPWVFRYPFETRGVILGVISAANARSLQMAKRLGFREVYRVRDGIKPGVDMVTVEMRREECRWLGGAK